MKYSDLKSRYEIKRVNDDPLIIVSGCRRGLHGGRLPSQGGDGEKRLASEEYRHLQGE